MRAAQNADTSNEPSQLEEPDPKRLRGNSGRAAASTVKEEEEEDQAKYDRAKYGSDMNVTYTEDEVQIIERPASARKRPRGLCPRALRSVASMCSSVWRLQNHRSPQNRSLQKGRGGKC